MVREFFLIFTALTNFCRTPLLKFWDNGSCKWFYIRVHGWETKVSIPLRSTVLWGVLELAHLIRELCVTLRGKKLFFTSFILFIISYFFEVLFYFIISVFLQRLKSIIYIFFNWSSALSLFTSLIFLSLYLSLYLWRLHFLGLQNL